MKKPVLFLNLSWVVIAAGTFYAGVVWREGRSVVSEVTAVGPRVPVTPGLPKMGAGEGLVKAGTVSRDDDVLDFFKRYGLDGGTPLTADTMTRAVTEALRETNPIKSQMLFARLMEELTPENAQSALTMLRENTAGWESMRYMGMLAYAWGGVDPKAAMEQLQQGGGRDTRMGQASALTGWAAQDPKGAVAWLAAYEGEGKEWMSQSLISGLAKSDFDTAFKYATAIEEGGDKTRAAETLSRELIRTGGIDKAREWFASLTDANMKDGAFGTLTDQLRRSDPDKVADFVRQHATQPYARDAVANMAEELGRKDVQEGLKFVNGLTGPNQPRAYAEVVGEWMDRNEGADSVQASEYVTRMPAGDNRDAAASVIARRMADEDPAAAIAWASSIGGAEQRQEAMVEVGRRYMRSDPVNGAAWLAQSGLSPEAQQQVTAPREERNWRGGGGGPPAGGPPGGGRRGPR